MTIDKLMTEVLNMDYDEILDMAKKSLPTVLKTIDAMSDTNDESFNMFLNIIGSMISSDGVVRDHERQLYCDLFNSRMNFDQFYDLISGRNDSDLRSSVNGFLDAVGEVSQDVKNEFLILLLCFAVVDERLAADEKAYFKELFN